MPSRTESADPSVDLSVDGSDDPAADGDLRGRLAWAAKSGYAAAARGAGRALTSVGLLPVDPPDRDRRIRHWLTSLARVHDSLAIAQLDVPWWTYRSIDIVEAWIRGRDRVRVFEFGSGASTLWLAARTDEVHSVEHHRGFAELIGPVLDQDPRIRFRLIEPVPTSAPGVASAKPGHAGLDFTDYVHAIDAIDGRFDLIVIDGRARAECLRHVVGRLAPGGIIVFDNTRRPRYRRAIEASGLIERRLPGLTPTLPYPDQTSLLSVPSASGGLGGLPTRRS